MYGNPEEHLFASMYRETMGGIGYRDLMGMPFNLVLNYADEIVKIQEEEERAINKLKK